MGCTYAGAQALPAWLVRVVAVAVDTPRHGKVLFSLVLTTFFWGGSFLFSKIGVSYVPPQVFVLIRFGLAAAIMMLVCLPRLSKLDRLTLQRGAVVGVALGVTNLTFVFGVQGTSISRAGVINNLFVLFIPIISRVLFKERIGLLNSTGILLASLGIALLAGGNGEGLNRGDLISTLCALFIAVHIMTVSKVLKDEDVWLVSMVQFGVVALIAGLSVLVMPPTHFDLPTPALLSIVYCAIFPTVICFTLQNRYQRYVTPTQAGLIYTLDPVWSLIAGFFFLGERLVLEEWLGCSFIFLAVVIPLLVRYVGESTRTKGNKDELV